MQTATQDQTQLQRQVREQTLLWLSLGLVALVGLINIPFPFNGDQAFFALAAQEMANGEVLYRDFWDLKQPGIFVFYYLVSRLLGASEVSIHGVEWLCMITFALLLVRVLNARFRHRVGLALVPLLTVGIYYSVSPSLFLTQVESLVGIPLFCVIVCLQQALDVPRYRARWLFAAGLLGALILLLKLLFLIVLAPIGLISLFWLSGVSVNRDGLTQNLSIGRRCWVTAKLLVPLLLGLLLPWLVTLAYFYSQGSLGIVYKTFFVYPPMIVAEAGKKDWFQFIESLGFFGVAFFPCVVLGGMQVYQTLRRSQDLLMINLAIWAMAGLLTIWLQSQGWWPYYYLLLFVPLGILAAHSIDSRWVKVQTLWRRLYRHRLRRFVLVIIGCLLFLPPVMGLSVKAFLLGQNQFAISPSHQLQYQKVIQDDYQEALDEVAVITQPKSLPGSIFVMGNPLFYFFSGRQQAGPINGWALEYLTESLWEQMGEQLTTQKPAYIFIASYYQKLVEKKSPEISTLLEQDYERLRQSEVGTWYVDSSHL